MDIENTFVSRNVCTCTIRLTTTILLPIYIKLYPITTNYNMDENTCRTITIFTVDGSTNTMIGVSFPWLITKPGFPDGPNVIIVENTIYIGLHVPRVHPLHNIDNVLLIRECGQSSAYRINLISDTQNCGLRMHRACREHSPRHYGLTIPTCITAGAVSFEVGGGENVPDIPGACATCNFAYMIRGPYV